MSRNRFVQPEIVRLPLSDGDFVNIKKQLTHGEREDFFATIAPFDLGGLSRVDRHLLRTTRVLTYLVGWSLVGKDGAPVPYSLDLSERERTDTIRGLDPDTFDEIHKAIEGHIEAIDATRKNGQGDASASNTISPSPSDVTGPTTTSVN